MTFEEKEVEDGNRQFELVLTRDDGVEFIKSIGVRGPGDGPIQLSEVLHPGWGWVEKFNAE